MIHNPAPAVCSNCVLSGTFVLTSTAHFQYSADNHFYTLQPLRRLPGVEVTLKPSGRDLN
jgi:hypothetical protein